MTFLVLAVLSVPIYIIISLDSLPLHVGVRKVRVVIISKVLAMARIRVEFIHVKLQPTRIHFCKKADEKLIKFAWPKLQLHVYLTTVQRSPCASYSEY